MKRFEETILAFIQQESLIKVGDQVLVACSGGVDSIVLLHFLATNKELLGIKVAAVHVDHMLRGEQSMQDGELVKKLCEQLTIPFYGGHLPIPELIEKSGGNLQAVCREERYAFFTKVMQDNNYTLLATAHHAEDQLETVLMEVTKGSVPSGISIMRKFEEGLLIRPFLPAGKEMLYNYAKENNLQFNEDPSNDSDAYMRNRFRKHIVPHILQENLAAPEKFFAMTRQLHEDETFLQQLAKEQVEQQVEFTETGLPTMNSNQFTSMPTALQRRVIKLLLDYLYNEEKIYVPYKSSLIEQIIYHLNSTHGNVSIDLPLSYQFLREYDKLTFVKESKNLAFEHHQDLPKGVQTEWLNGQWLYWSNVEDVDVYIVAQATTIMYFNLPNDSLSLFVRQRKEGDRIHLLGMDKSKRLSRLFIDEKVSRTNRDKLPVIVAEHGEIFAVPGLRYGHLFTKNKEPTSKYVFAVGEK